MSFFSLFILFSTGLLLHSSLLPHGTAASPPPAPTVAPPPAHICAATPPPPPHIRHRTTSFSMPLCRQEPPSRIRHAPPPPCLTRQRALPPPPSLCSLASPASAAFLASPASPRGPSQAPPPLLSHRWSRRELHRNNDNRDNDTRMGKKWVESTPPISRDGENPYHGGIFSLGFNPTHFSSHPNTGLSGSNPLSKHAVRF